MKLPKTLDALKALAAEVDAAIKEAEAPKVKKGDAVWVKMKVEDVDPDDPDSTYYLEAVDYRRIGGWISHDQIDSILASQPTTKAPRGPRRGRRKAS